MRAQGSVAQTRAAGTAAATYGAKKTVMRPPMAAAAAVCTKRAEAVVLRAAWEIHFCSDCMEMNLLTDWPIQSKRLLAVLRRSSLACIAAEPGMPTLSMEMAASRLCSVLSMRLGPVARVTTPKVMISTAKKLEAMRIMSAGPHTSTL